MKLVLFDCDGTIVDSAGIIHRCMGEAFRQNGLKEATVEAVKSIIGLSLDVAIARLAPQLPERDIPAVVDAYKTYFLSMRSDTAFHEPVFAGMDTLISEIGARDDIQIGMVTGKSRRGVAAVLDRLGLAHHFVTVRTADDCPSKPHPAMVLECIAETGVNAADTLVVGDAIYDIEMACAAGAVALGVSWGYHDVASLTASGAHAILARPADLHEWLSA